MAAGAPSVAIAVLVMLEILEQSPHADASREQNKRGSQPGISCPGPSPFDYWFPVVPYRQAASTPPLMAIATIQ